MFLAKIIPRILHNVNRVCYVFGGHVLHQITDITHTRISKYTISQLRQADHLANQVILGSHLLERFSNYYLFFTILQALRQFDCYKHISQMPVVLIPVHFDRDPAARIPSCSRSIVLRPFLSSDFMTGVPILPGSDRLPINVSIHFSNYL